MSRLEADQALGKQPLALKTALAQPLGRHDPDAIVAWTDGGPRSAGDLLREAGSLGELLPARDATGGEILVLCTDRWRFAVSALAAWRAGYSLALPPNAQPQALFERIAEARLVLHDGDCPAGLESAVAAGIDLRSLAPPEASAPQPVWRPLAPDQRIATLHTSGTSGASRSVAKTALQLFGEAETLGALLDVTAEDRLLATVPPQHIYGLLLGLLVPLLRGASMVCGAGLHAEAIAARARQTRATVLASVPAQLRAFSVLGEHALGRLRLIVSSSAPLDPAVAETLRRFHTRVVELLGSTETGGIASREPPDALWRPLPGVGVRADPEGRLELDSPFVDAREPVPYATADRVVVEASGLFQHLGRLDGVVKIAGKRVAVDEMERRLRSLPGVEDAALRAIPVGRGRSHEIWAAVVAPGAAVETLRGQLGAWYDPVTIPRRWRLLTRLPRAVNGKLPLDAWQALFAAEQRPPIGLNGFLVSSRSARWDGEIEHRQIDLVVPADLSYFAGHFDRLPILSGVAIVNALVLAESRCAWPDLGRLLSVSDLKFRKPVAPGLAAELRLSRGPGAGVSFSLSAGEKSYSAGTLTFGVVP